MHEAGTRGHQRRKQRNNGYWKGVLKGQGLCPTTSKIMVTGLALVRLSPLGIEIFRRLVIIVFIGMIVKYFSL